LPARLTVVWRSAKSGLAINPETLREILNSSLYLYISKLTDTNNVTSRSIPKLIADRGYQLGSKKLLAIFKKFLPGTIATIFTGILVNLIVTQLTRQVDEPKPSPPCTKFENCQISKGLCVYGGSASWAPLRKLLEEKLLKTHPDFQLQYQDPFDAKPSSGRGVKMLIEGEIDIGLSSRPLREKSIQVAKDRSITLREIKVARNAVAVIVNPRLKLSGITMSQIKDIYEGRLQNWKELGGPNLAIQPFIRSSTVEGDTKSFFDQGALNKNKKLQKVQNVTDGVRKVSNTPGGIFMGSASLMIRQCTVKIMPVGQKTGEFFSPAKGSSCPYELNREVIREGKYPHAYTNFLFLVYKENDPRSKRCGENLATLLLTPEGQQLVEEAGFVPIQ